MPSAQNQEGIREFLKSLAAQDWVRRSLRGRDRPVDRGAGHDRVGERGFLFPEAAVWWGSLVRSGNGRCGGRSLSAR